MTKRKAIIICSAAAAVIAAAVVLINVFKKDGGYNFEYVSVSDAVKNAESVLGTKYENFTLSETLDIDVSGDLYTISADNISSTCNKEEMSAQLAELLGAGKKQSSEEDHVGTVKTDYENDVTVWCYDDRTFTAARAELTLPEWALDNSKMSKLYVIGRDSLDDKYILNGEEYSIKDAVEYAENFANEKLLPLLINDTKVKAVAAAALKVNEENYWIFVQLQHYMFGCPVSTTGGALQGEPFMKAQSILVTFDGKEQICHIQNEGYVAVNDKKKVDKIISLPSALKYLEKELAPESNYMVTSLSLEYCTKIENNEREFEYRPMWCLTVSERAGDHIFIYPRKVIYVDALNGDICCFSDIEHTMIF